MILDDNKYLLHALSCACNHLKSCCQWQHFSIILTNLSKVNYRDLTFMPIECKDTRRQDLYPSNNQTVRKQKGGDHGNSS